MYNFVVSIAIIVLGFLCVVECIRSGKRRKEEELRIWVSRAVKTALFVYTYTTDIYEFTEEFLIKQGIVSEKDFHPTHIGKLEAMIFAEIYNQVR
jgi:hypothetical protein